jgi:hypothetical protein
VAFRAGRFIFFTPFPPTPGKMARGGRMRQDGDATSFKKNFTHHSRHFTGGTLASPRHDEGFSTDRV